MAPTLTSLVVAAVMLTSSLAFAQTPAGAGPKKRVAVIRFETIGSFTQVYGGWDIGGALAAQLATELTQTGRFIVLERTHLTPALREQELGLMGVTTGETAAPAGQVLGAQILVQGVVTQFEQAAAGKGLQVGLGIGGASIGLGGNKETGHVVIDLRLVDATTGAVVQAHKAEGKVSQKSVKAEVGKGGVSIGNTAFNKTALGAATRDALEQAVKMIVNRMETLPWTGRVVDAGDGQIFVNAGLDANLAPGQRLMVSTVAKQLVDPATGTSLGVVERKLGEIEIESVEDKFSIARPLVAMSVARGDIVRIATVESSPAASLTTRDRGLLISTSRPATPTPDTLRHAIAELDSASAAGMQAGMYAGAMPMAMPAPAGAVAPLPESNNVKR